MAWWAACILSRRSELNNIKTGVFQECIRKPQLRKQTFWSKLEQITLSMSIKQRWEILLILSVKYARFNFRKRKLSIQAFCKKARYQTAQAWGNVILKHALIFWWSDDISWSSFHSPAVGKYHQLACPHHQRWWNCPSPWSPSEKRSIRTTGKQTNTNIQLRHAKYWWTHLAIRKPEWKLSNCGLAAF